jgi:hypothetical protein
LYAIGFFLHLSVAALVIVRILIELPAVFRRIVSIFMVSGGLLCTLLNYVFESIASSNRFIVWVAFIVDKAYGYYYRPVSSILENIKGSELELYQKFTYSLFVILILILNLIIVESSHENKNFKSLQIYSELLSIIVIACIPMWSQAAHWRFAAIVILISSFAFLGSTVVNTGNLTVAIFRLMLIVCAMACSLSVLFKTIFLYDYIGTSKSFILTSPIIEIIKCLNN